MHHLRITPELVQYHEQRITRQIADGDLVVYRKFLAYQRKYMTWRTKRRTLNTYESERYKEKAWLLWLEEYATHCAGKHKDTDFVPLVEVAKSYSLSPAHVFQVLQTNHIPVILMATKQERTCVHQYIFSCDLKRTRTLFATLEAE